MMKQIFLTALLLSTLFGIGAYIKTEKAPEMTITIEKNSFKSTLLNNEGDNKNIFKCAFKENVISNIKYIKTGGIVTINFGDKSPDKLTIKDYLLNPSQEHKGEQLYTDKEIVDVPYTKEKNKYSFTIETHKASFLSSSYIKSKTDFRGYKISVVYGKKEYDYIFVIETDSTHPNIPVK